MAFCNMKLEPGILIKTLAPSANLRNEKLGVIKHLGENRYMMFLKKVTSKGSYSMYKVLYFNQISYAWCYNFEEETTGKF